jgi:large subunit ribosomal protein L32
MRANRSKTGKRRSHHALGAARLAQCECGSVRMPHRACANCGKYNGRVAIDVVARAARATRRDKRRTKRLRESGQISEGTKEQGSAKT